MAASDTPYFVVVGRVAFDPQERDVNGKKVIDVTVKSSPKQRLVRCTIWPDIDGSGIAKGDFVLAEGKYSVSTGNNGQEYHNLSVADIGVVKALPKADRAVANAAAPAADTDSDDDPF